MNKKMENMIINCYSNLNNIFREDEDRENFNPITGDLDETFFTAELLALKMQFNHLTGKELDLLEFIALLNKLAFQFLQEDTQI